MRNCLDKAASVEIKYSIKEECSGLTVLTAPEVTKAALEAGTTIEVVLPESILDNPVLWHFDNPHLYTACVQVTPAVKSCTRSRLLSECAGSR